MTLDRESVFVGRAAELDDVGEWLAGDGWLLTLRGPGGAGKTTIARRVAGEQGVPFVELESCRTEDDVWTALGAAVECGPEPDAVAEHVQQRLVVLDNAEHITRIIQTVLKRLGGGRFLVTSRERLALPNERLVDVGPMDRVAARELFERRVLSVMPSFAVDDVENAALDRLIDALDRLPLALVLAASRSQFMTPTQIFERLDGAQTLSDRRADGGRHASVDACVAWSWELLDDDARDTLRQCAIFRGWFTLADAEAVIETDGWVGDTIEELLDHSLLTVDRSPTPRFGLYGAVRRFVDRETAPSPELVERYVAHLATAIEDHNSALDPFNLLHAFDLGTNVVPARATELILEARQRLWRAGFVRQTLPRLRRATTELELTPELTTRAYLAIAACHDALQDDDAVMRALDDVEQRLDGVNDGTRLQVTAAAAMLRAAIYERESKIELAREQRERGVAALAERTDATPLEQVHLLSMCGLSALRTGAIEEGSQHLSRALDVAARSNHDALHARALSWNATALLMSGRVERGVGQLQQSLELFAGHDDFVSQAQAEYMLCIATSLDDPKAAIAMTHDVELTANKAGLDVLAAGARVVRARLLDEPDAATAIRRELNVIRRSPHLADRLAPTLSLVVVLVLDEELDEALQEVENAIATLCERPAEERFLNQYRTVITALIAGAAVPPDALAEHDAWAHCLFDYNPMPRELLDTMLQRRARSKLLRVFDDGERVITVDGDEVDLQPRNLLRRLLLRLLEAHEAGPGTAVTVDDLLEAGWPDETMTYESGVRRVYSAIRNLRKLGFEETIITDEAGYIIDPDIIVKRG